MAYTDKWDVINLSHAPLSSEEAEEREEALAEVMDPMFLFRAQAEADADADAEGEIHIEETAATVNGNRDVPGSPMDALHIEVTTWWFLLLGSKNCLVI